MVTERFVFLSYKAFGDFVIAYSSLKLVSDIEGPNVMLYAAPHLKPLVDALRVDGSIVSMMPPALLGHERMPAIFDLRQRGLLRGLDSLVKLKLSINRLPISESMVVFDRLGLREKFLSLGLRSSSLISSKSKNIYLDYLDLFGHDPGSKPMAPSQSATKHALIVPGSRVPAKCMNSDVILESVKALRNRGYSTTVLALDNERISLTRQVPIKIIPQSFGELTRAISCCDLLVSADSLPAHLGEFFGKPTFVMTPLENTYWLPLRAFLSGAYATFKEPSLISDWLRTQN